MSPEFSNLKSFGNYVVRQRVEGSSNILISIKQVMQDLKLPYVWVTDDKIKKVMSQFVPLWSSKPVSEEEWNSIYPGHAILASIIDGPEYNVSVDFEHSYADISYPYTQFRDYYLNRDVYQSLTERGERGLWELVKPHASHWSVNLLEPLSHEFLNHITLRLKPIKDEIDFVNAALPILEQEDLEALINLFAQYDIPKIDIIKLKKQFSLPIDPSEIEDGHIVDLV